MRLRPFFKAIGLSLVGSAARTLIAQIRQLRRLSPMLTLSFQASPPAHCHDENANFSANCLKLASTAVLLMRPNVGEVKLVSEFANWVCFGVLKKFRTQLEATSLNGSSEH
jgi:hypothetical protein